MKYLSYGLILSVMMFADMQAQTDSVSLFDLLKSARQHAAIAPREEIFREINEFETKRISTGNLPTVKAYGKATYQSDAITVSMPGAPGLEIDLFQYNAGVEANQKLFDGGSVKRSLALQEASNLTDQKMLQVDLYKINNQVVAHFFQIQLLQKNREIITLKITVLEERYKELQSAYNAGVVKRNDLDKLKAELLTAKQQEMTLSQSLAQQIAQLEELTRMDLADAPALYLSQDLAAKDSSGRPELEYLAAQRAKSERLALLQQTKNYPKLAAFAQMGYSYPGLNFFENQSNYYYIVGARLSWTIFDWQENHHKIQAIQKQQDILATQEDEFLRSMQAAVTNEIMEQQKLSMLINFDEEIVREREAIRRGSEKALNNGVATSAEYLEDVNAEMQARIEREIHLIQLDHSRVRLKLLNGIEL